MNKNATLKNALHVAVERNHNLNAFMRNFADIVRLPAPNKKKIDFTQVDFQRFYSYVFKGW